MPLRSESIEPTAVPRRELVALSIKPQYINDGVFQTAVHTIAIIFRHAGTHGSDDLHCVTFTMIPLASLQEEIDQLVKDVIEDRWDFIESDPSDYMHMVE